MRRLFIFATVLFWLAVAALWLAAALQPARVGSPEVESAAPVEARYTLAEVAAHDRAEDCWMAIDGVVYELTAYLPEHPTSLRLIADWCGQEASVAYHTKTRGRPHSPHADSLLPAWRIGVLAPLTAAGE
jgi:cytochrome b involved in lipid metabolism